MDITGIKTDGTTGSDLTSETDYCDATGSYKSLTVRPTENKETHLNPVNSGSDYTGESETSTAGSDRLFTLTGSKVSHSKPCDPKTIGIGTGSPAGSTAVNQEVTSSAGLKESSKNNFPILNSVFLMIAVEHLNMWKLFTDNS